MANYYNFRKAMAIQAANKKRWLKLHPLLNDNSGIYILTRVENGIKYAYIGQAKHILTRLAQHLAGYQHIDLSLKRHGLYSFPDNETGWKVDFLNCDEILLDEKEREYIKEYASLGYQLRNKTIGGQDKGKSGMDDNKASKGYHDGLKQGYVNAIRDIKVYFSKYLDVIIKGVPNKVKERKLTEFKETYYEKENS